jgi:hypothetical protein
LGRSIVEGLVVCCWCSPQQVSSTAAFSPFMERDTIPRRCLNLSTQLWLAVKSVDRNR